mmetsp:Transcript_9474/g.29494  ORF Transcript_9474/g.29494 Transcript_9474/m.29494 type:complete len:245 (+) Transcript_9474:184-918(+)
MASLVGDGAFSDALTSEPPKQSAAKLIADAERIKAEGNELFKAKEYKKAVTRFAKIRAYTWLPSGEAAQYGGGQAAARDYSPEDCAALLRLDQIACGNMAQCYVELGEFRKALDFSAKVAGPAAARGTEDANRQDREASNPDLHVKALSRSARALLALGDLDASRDFVLRALALDPRCGPARATHKKLQAAYKQHAAEQKKKLGALFAAEPGSAAPAPAPPARPPPPDDEPPREEYDEDPSDGA